MATDCVKFLRMLFNKIIKIDLILAELFLKKFKEGVETNCRCNVTCKAFSIVFE